MTSTATEQGIGRPAGAGGNGATGVDLAAALDAVEAVRPVLEQHRDWAEANRRLAERGVPGHDRRRPHPPAAA